MGHDRFGALLPTTDVANPQTKPGDAALYSNGMRRPSVSNSAVTGTPTPSGQSALAIGPYLNSI